MPNERPLLCAWCNKDCTHRPVAMEASCWECWYRNVGAPMAIHVWERQKPWWRRRWMLPINPRWEGPLNYEKGRIRGH